MNRDPSGWQVGFTVAAANRAVFEVALDSLGCAVHAGEVAGGDAWFLAGYFAARPDAAELGARLAVAAAAAGVAVPEAVIEAIPDADWVAAYRAHTGPVACGRFFIQPSHDRSDVPDGAIRIALDAGLAFGTGEHHSTQGCLTAFEDLSRRKIGRALDMGCGSGILAIAMARLWRGRVLAVDNDPVAVGVAGANVRANRVASRVTVAEGAGFSAPVVQRRGPFDLIAANILAGPLIAMAGGMAEHLARRGAVVLSGLLQDQEEQVSAPYLAHGLAVTRSIHNDGWSTLVLGRDHP